MLRIKRPASRIEDRIPDPEEPVRTRVVGEALSTTVELFADLKRPLRLNAHNLHPDRLKVKQVRDVVPLVDRPMQSGLVESLVEVKDAIGNWHVGRTGIYRDGSMG